MSARRACLPLLACAALAPGLAMAEAPRSAIPWLSESIVTGAPPPPGRGEAPADPDAITVAPLGDVSRDAVGLLPPERTGFPRDLWGERAVAEVRDLVLGAGGSGVPAAIALFREILLAEADPPPGSDAGSALLIARIDRLLDMGALDEAEALVEAAGPNSPDLFRRWFDLGLLLDRAEPACDALKGNPSLSPTLPARVFCLARGGDWNAAEITLTLGKGVGSIPDAQEELLARFLDPVLFEETEDPPIPDPLTPLDFLLREAVGLPRPPGPLPLAFLRGDLEEHAPMRARIDASERLWLAGSLTASGLLDAYRGGEPAASGGVWDRARAIQAFDAALAKGYAETVGATLVAADDAMSARGLRVGLAKGYAESLRVLNPAVLSETARARLAELLILAGETEAADAVARTLGNGQLTALVAVAAGGAPEAVPEDPAPSERFRAALAGLGAGAPADDRETRLAELAKSGQIGETILEALDLVSAGAEADPPSLRAALFALRAAGEEKAAREIAVQTLLARPAP
ncbi:hypothetical protein [Amaricoccus solimangrovi]|uniref:Uncharacterized protein n=1 Tax=Amaricoccus solimangrovi TaxID=2589815 RepID=A0A501WVA2_9RHOB|nr:hypothetical protein [Amaricoccus solimangrovi]TPE53683.1 hypothetical protein FJM51_01145 [Amaricoccus solimangrovi]